MSQTRSVPSAGAVACLLIGLALGASGCSKKKGARQAAQPPAVAQPAGAETTRLSRTFSSYDDFTGPGATASGLHVELEGQLSITHGVSLFETPFMWVSNSAEGTLSRIDTKTLEVAGPFALVSDTGEQCYNPSRTTVDMEGNVWVGCRGFSGGKNREDVTPEMVPETVDTKVMKMSYIDGSVLLSIHVGHAPRALALDTNNHLWVGCSVDDTVWELDGTTGQCYTGERPDCQRPVIAVGDYPYGGVVDQRGHLWVVNKRDVTLAEINTATAERLAIHGPYMRDYCGTNNTLYGIAVDRLNNIWTGGARCSDVLKIKGFTGVSPADGKTYEAGELMGAYMSGGERTRGVAVDLDDNIWVANSETDNASKIQGSTGELLATVTVGDKPIGVGVDATGDVWVVNRGSNSVHRLSGLDTSLKEEVVVGLGPYTYSDMLGLSLRAITHRPEEYGAWVAAVDAGSTSIRWESITWQAEQPEGTAVRVRFRCAETEAALAAVAWGPLLDAPGDLVCETPQARFGQVEVQLYPSSTGVSPVVDHLTVVWQTDEP